MPRLDRRKSGEGIAFITCRLCDRSFRCISFAHLVRKHDFDPEDPILDYLRRFSLSRSKCLETIRQGRQKFIHFLALHGRRWTKTRVILTIRDRIKRRLPINLKAVSGQDALATTAQNLFGSWEAAVHAAGFNYRTVRLRRSWTKKEVVAAIGRAKRSGRDLFDAAVAAWDPGLRSTAMNHFGSWDSALRAAGLDPEKIRLARRWTSERVVASIRALARRMEVSKIGHHDPGLLGAARLRFGSWTAALRKAGISYPIGRDGWAWTKERILTAIQDRADRGLDIRAISLHDEQRGLYVAGQREFGSWKAAVEAAGLSVPSPIKWTRDSIVATLQARARRGLSIRSTHVHRDCGGLEDAARRVFGSWRTALSKAGLSAPLPYRLKWTREAIAETLRMGARHQKTLNREWANRHGGLREAARREFGSWHGALRASGVKLLS